jgi:flavin-dependent dehydrogenase
MKDYDIVTVGGGLGGSTLAKVMAERGARVLVVEREAQFKDRALIFMELGPEADAIRARALPLIMQDPSRVPPAGMSGPDAPHDDSVRRRFFGEE